MNKTAYNDLPINDSTGNQIGQFTGSFTIDKDMQPALEMQGVASFDVGAELPASLRDLCVDLAADGKRAFCLFAP